MESVTVTGRLRKRQKTIKPRTLRVEFIDPVPEPLTVAQAGLSTAAWLWRRRM
jgi:hypothetical protein